MSYPLIQLAPAPDNLLLHGEVLGSVVRSGSDQPYTLTAELLENLPWSRLPSPFREVEHTFPSPEEPCAWLGHPPVQTNNSHTAARVV
ncbi:hypothetical protein SAMN02927923_03779 [Microvirga guangxiensis]|uniref:Uncharacterized protein n=2 Tax=Microvirga guangxiensis TaxID=549386 RepID=A0A1G5L026_9HYPH|nr:hypothetical protein SAMN02927923_03779 [Microvirga guangxiensis]